jgi:hypothetical protein
MRLSSLSRPIGFFVLAAPLLTACASNEGRIQQAELKSESECRVASAPNKCMFEHDLANGLPFSLGMDR